jgi:hypothetical protein
MCIIACKPLDYVAMKDVDVESSIPLAMSHESQELENYHIMHTIPSKQITYVRGKKSVHMCSS